jgi:hypothetical protein
MKKIKWFFFCLLAFVFTSCVDETDEYVRPVYLNSEISAALKECLTVSVDTAVTHLCDTNGFSQYDEGAYLIELPSSANDIVSTLTANGHEGMIDSLISKINIAAESCGENVITYYDLAITNFTFPDPNTILNGNDSAATDYLKSIKTVYLLGALNSSVKTKMDNSGATAAWNQVLTTYYTYQSQPVSIDLTAYMTKKIVDGIFSEMYLEEYNIRHNPDHRSSTLMKKVFALLDYEE